MYSSKSSLHWRLGPGGGSLAAAGIATALAAVSTSAFAGPGICLPDPGAGHVYLCDPLDNGKSESSDVAGGNFGSEGWTSLAFGDRIHYDLGTAVSEGRLSFWVRGLALSETSLNNDNHHIVEMFDKGGHHGGDHFDFVTGFRVFGSKADAQWVGKVKFFYGAVDTIACPGPSEANLKNWDTSVWQAALWHHIEIVFGGGTAVLRFDDVESASLEYGTCPSVFRQLYIPNNPWVQSAIDSVDGAEYAYVSFSGTSGCTGSCDDGNGCTSGDSCHEGLCTGTAVADGTACIVQGAAGVCAAGVCQAQTAPDAGPDASLEASLDAPLQDAAAEVQNQDVLTDGAKADGAAEGGVADARDGSTSKPDGSGAGSGASPSDDGGCGCRTIGRAGSAFDRSGLLVAILFAAAAWMERSRRRFPRTGA